MPYINSEDRLKYEGEINVLITKLQENNSPGELNYVISRIIWGLFRNKPSYTKGNELMGVLECVKQEFYRRQLGIYEEIKLEKNGDI